MKRHRHPPLPPRRVRAFLILKHRKGKIMPNVGLTWVDSVSPNATGYQLTWNRNGASAAPVVKPANAVSSDYTTDVTGIVLNPGDTVFCTVVTLDSTDSLQSTPVVSNTVTIPTPVQPPAPPTNVVATLLA